MAHRRKHPFYLVLLALMNGQGHYREARRHPIWGYFGPSGVLRVHGLNGRRSGDAVLQLNASLQLGDSFRAQSPLYEGQVGLGLLLGGMEQRLGQVAIGGEEQEARSVVVQTPHREDPWITVLGDDICHAGAPLGVIHGGDHARGLVQDERDRLRGQVVAHPVDGNHVFGRIHLGAKLGHHLAVDLHAPGSHEVF